MSFKLREYADKLFKWGREARYKRYPQVSPGEFNIVMTPCLSHRISRMRPGPLKLILAKIFPFKSIAKIHCFFAPVVPMEWIELSVIIGDAQ